MLIVEFAKQLEEEGRSTIEAVINAYRLRLLPIVMASFAFLIGVLPLAEGLASQQRQVLGTSVFAGMLGVTMFGLIVTLMFYVVQRYLPDRLWRHRAK